MKLRSTGLMVALGLPLMMSASRQNRTPNFSGVWWMDTTKFEKHDPVLVALQLTIRQAGDSVSLLTDVTDQRGPGAPLTKTSTPTVLQLDGRPRENRMGNGDQATMVTAWAHDTLTYMSRTISHVDSQPLTITTRWVLDGSGTTLTQIQRMQHGSRDRTQTLLFTKR